MSTGARRRRARPDDWKRHHLKRQRATGREYINAKGDTVSAKKPKPVNCERCRYKCSDTFNSAARDKLCQEYYDLADYSRQKDFLCAHIVEVSPRSHKTQFIGKCLAIARGYYLSFKWSKVTEYVLSSF